MYRSLPILQWFSKILFVQQVLYTINWGFYVIIHYIKIIYIMLNPQKITLGLVYNTALHFILTSSFLDCLSKCFAFIFTYSIDYSHIYIDFVFL